VRPERRHRSGAGSSAAQRVDPPRAREPDRLGDVAVGLAVIAYRLGTDVGRLALLPAHLISRFFLVRPVVRSATEGLGAAGRDAQARGRRQLEETAAGILSAPETARTFERALTGPPPVVLGDETIERLAKRVLESRAFEEIVRDVAESPTVRRLSEEALRSADLQRAVEEVLAGPVRTALRHETTTYWSQVAAALRQASRRLDAAVERAARRALRRSAPAVAPAAPAVGYAGLVSRCAAFAADAAITHFAALVVGSLLGVVGSLLGLSAPGPLVVALAAGGWAVLVGGYFVFFWATAGQTPGMRILGLRVTDRHGGIVRPGRSLVRLLGAALAVAPLGLGLLPVLVDRQRRALQDFLARTVVVHDGAGVEISPPPDGGHRDGHA
jgi:uncharacterized RDD family membrane protein YckC